ncbi:hypothetical protein A7A78_03115 [Aequorivita soesokkakensis]|uniref:Uncharacterized protein n=2 Tax=Aequorivita soesokkakensis TaxID=1385699 RepID=A0A1A9LDZ8_9FLAO|nr:hypothetical protein A7A78_03115 [Aequorivita soesokkakensis]
MCTPGGGDDCNCGPITGRYFDINGMELNNYKKVGENSVSLMVENEAVPYSDYSGLTVEYSVDYISQKRSKWPNFSLTPSAYACSCVGNGESGSKNEKLSNLTVITLNDFDETHRANDTIDDLILVKGYYSEVDEYLEDYLVNDTQNIQFEGIQLLVDRKPTLNENYKVKVVVELSTGEVYQKVSETIKIR